MTETRCFLPIRRLFSLFKQRSALEAPSSQPQNTNFLRQVNQSVATFFHRGRSVIRGAALGQSPRICLTIYASAATHDRQALSSNNARPKSSSHEIWPGMRRQPYPGHHTSQQFNHNPPEQSMCAGSAAWRRRARPPGSLPMPGPAAAVGLAKLTGRTATSRRHRTFHPPSG